MVSYSLAFYPAFAPGCPPSGPVCPPVAPQMGPVCPPGGFVNLDVDCAPGFATLDVDYGAAPPHPLPGMGVMAEMREMAEVEYEAPCPEPAQHVYIVRKGDTIWKLAKRFGTTMQAIIQANNLTNPDLIYPGQRLCIPVTAWGRG